MIKADFELWKDVEGFEGLYQVSTWGNVRSLDRYVNTIGNSKRLIKGKIIKPRLDRYGYLKVMLSKNGNKKYILLHRLVALNFISNPDNLPQVNHIDEVKTNNFRSNLEWCDSKYNNNYGTHKERVAKSHWKKVYQYNREYKLVKIWPSLVECEKNGFIIAHISSCCSGKRKSHKGYIWSYKPIEKFNTEYYSSAFKDSGKSKKVFQYSKEYELIKIWPSVRDCGRNGFDHRTISSCCLGKQKTHRGYIWSYTEIGKELQ